MTTPATSGRGWAYTGVTLGGLVSIAANVAHSFIPPTGTNPTSWAPEPGAIVGAVVWPVFLFIAVEILARVSWPHGGTWKLLRFGGILPVAAAAALVSYRHLSGLLTHYGEETIVSILGPLAVDGLMVMAAGALLATGRPPTTNTPPTLSVPAPARSTIADRQAPTPSVNDTASDVPAAPDPVPVPEPIAVPAREQVPSPAQVAARITPTRTTNVATVLAADLARREPSPRPRKSTPGTPVVTLAPSTTDTPVTASDAAQLTLPVVSTGSARTGTRGSGPIPHRARHADHRGPTGRPAQGAIRDSSPSFGATGPATRQPHPTDTDCQRPTCEGDPVTVSTLTVVSETTVSGTAPAAEPFTFYLGTHQPHWLRLGLGVPLFVSDRRLRGYRTLPRAEAVWALDSGGFNELSQYGTWDNGPPPASTRPGCAATAMRSAALGGRRRRTGCANPTSSPRPD